MPVIYGSSVKGVLRNYFLDEYKEADAHIVLADIFDGIRNGKPKPIYERDVFFDAVVIEDNDGKLLETDAITPHSENGLKNPRSYLISENSARLSCGIQIQAGRLCNHGQEKSWNYSKISS